MFRSRFFWKLFAGYIVLILLSTATIGLMASRRLSRDALAEIQTDLQVRTKLLEEMLEAQVGRKRAADLGAEVQRLGKASAARVTVIDLDGTVLADSDADPAAMENHLQRPEIQSALRGGDGASIRYSTTVDERMTYHAVPIEAGGTRIGFLRLGLSLNSLDERLAGVRSIIIAGALLSAFGAVVLAYFVARKITSPIIGMTAAAASIADGDYHQRVPKGPTDELGELAEAFNAMAAQLEERVDAITREHDKMMAILGGLVEGIIAVDRQKRVIHINSVAANLLGVSADWSVGRSVEDVIGVDLIHATIEDVLQDGEEADLEAKLDHKPGNFIIELHAAPMRDGDGRPIGAMVFFHDVTELRRLESIRRDFVANVSHELKTPITAIRGLSETLAQDPEMPEEVRQRFLEKIESQAMRLSALVTDLLTLARLESGTAVATDRRLDLRDPVSDSLNACLAVEEDHGARVEASIPEQPVMVKGDEQSLRQLTSNLLVNALKYTPKDGRVWLRLWQDGEHAWIEVQDTGIGIEPQHLKRIFERFYRVDKARSRELGGTGLGLSIVKHVCLAHGGEVWVKSALGKGSTFTVRLPLAA
jgi:two-component system phosphate regulon sensor histidine kinase PhoR